MNATSTMRTVERPVDRGGLVGPTVLIGLGLVFLFNTLGWLGWEVWETLLRLWPVLLIAVGLDLLIGRRSALGSALVALGLLLVVGMAVWWSAAWGPRGIPVATERVAQTLDGAARGDVEIGMGAGTLRLGALEDSTDLIQGTVGRSERAQVTRSFSVRGDTAYFTLRHRNASGWVFPFATSSAEQLAWDLRLNPDVPLHLKVESGAGTATLDLARLGVTDLEVNTGVGTTTLILPAQGQVQARVNGGVGETMILVPEGAAVRVSARVGLGQVAVMGGPALRRDEVYTSPGYDTAANRVELTVQSGVGSVTVQRAGGR